nr:early nodulin-like protein 1 [Ipomoea batatas]
MVECGRSMMVWVGFMCVILTALMWSSEGRPPRTFQAGGRDGWRLLPDDGLNRWAEKRRFRVNDTIAFEYEKGKDSVLVVRKRAYHHCNKTSPIHNMTDGFSTLKFTRNGHFYFISGYAQNCLNGQKLRLVVMSPNHRPSIPPTRHRHRLLPLCLPITAPPFLRRHRHRLLPLLRLRQPHRRLPLLLLLPLPPLTSLHSRSRRRHPLPPPETDGSRRPLHKTTVPARARHSYLVA